MPKFRDIPLFFKVVLSPLSAIIALVGMGILGVVNADQLEGRLTTLNDVIFQEVQQGLELKDAVAIFHAHLFALMSSAVNETDATRRDKAAAALHQELDQLSVALKGTMTTKAANAAVPDLPKLFDAYKQAAILAIDIGATDATYGVIMMGDADNQFWKLRQRMEALNTALSDERVVMVNALRAEGRSAGHKSVIVAISVSLASIAAALFISRQIAQPITRLTNTMTVLAQGEFDTAVPERDRGDEVGAMAGALDTFKDSMITNRRLEEEQRHETASRLERAERVAQHISAFERNLQSMLGYLGTAADDLRRTSDGMSATAEVTSQASAKAASGADQTSGAVETVAAATEELSSSINEVSHQVRVSSDVVGRAAREIAQTDQTIDSLRAAVEKIGDMVTMIFSIAHQTDLLALNATIEAARAGETGKGFAVVAAEVKALAKQTSKVTEDITSQIASIKTATDDAVQAIRDVGQTIGEVNAITTAVSAAAEQQAAATAEITRSAQSAAHSTADVSNNMASLRQGTDETMAAAINVNASAENIQRHSDSLQQTVDDFVLNLRQL